MLWNLILLAQVSDGANVVSAFLAEAGPWAGLFILYMFASGWILLRMSDKFERTISHIEQKHSEQMAVYSEGLREDRAAFMELIHEIKKDL
jgi:hypothetical protein